MESNPESSSSNISDNGPSQKKAKPNPDDDNSAIRILTFCADHQKNVKIQLLSSHTTYDLISTLCDNVSIADDETADDHLWFIEYNGKKYESSTHHANTTQLHELNLDLSSPIISFEYDYGGMFISYKIHFLGADDLVMGEATTGTTDDEEEVMKRFPRRKPVELPSGYVKYEPTDTSINLDTMYTKLQKWIFDSNSVTLHFFQPGRKNNWGFFYGTCNAMMFLPTKPDNLNNYLSYFDQGAARRRTGLEDGGDGYPHYNWHSVVILPRSKSTSRLESKYTKALDPGFIDCVHANDSSNSNTTNLNNVFPKLSALAGWKKDAKISKGWMTFIKKGNKCSIAIFKGGSHNHKNNAPKCTAYDGYKQHDSVEGPYLQTDGVEINGLQDLFCVAEGLLRSC